MNIKERNKYINVTNLVFFILLFLPVFTKVEYHTSVYFLLLIGILSNAMPIWYDMYKENSKK